MGENKKVANSVVAVGSAAVLAIYGAGYERTRAAADRFSQQAAERRPHIPAPRAERERAPLAVDAAAPELPQPEAPKPAPAPVNDTPAVSAALAPVTKPAAPAKAAPRAAKAAPQPDTTIAATTTEPTSAIEEDSAPAVPAAPVAPTPAAPAEPAKAGGFKDGTYYGWGTSRHGDIQAAVVIEEGKIMTARVERCLTRYSCSWITPIPPRILLKQGTTYDYVSGATESSDAFQDAVAEALFQAK